PTYAQRRRIAVWLRRRPYIRPWLSPREACTCRLPMPSRCPSPGFIGNRDTRQPDQLGTFVQARNSIHRAWGKCEGEHGATPDIFINADYFSQIVIMFLEGNSIRVGA